MTILNRLTIAISVFLFAAFILSSSSLNISIFAQNSSFGLTRCANYNSITNIITVICNTSLSQIYNNINNRNVLEKDPSGIWILKSSIIVNPQSKLTINHNDASWIKITNNKNNQPNYISISGSAVIDGVKITSW